ncbi:MAG: aminoacetone oxidase family FAD-binding enzyme [Clostridia bacterium]|nr:aminoacetone oxidase family FAD-binding enzyme [Clostridia bacterium]
MKNYDVIIIGAGASGLMAGCSLVKNSRKQLNIAIVDANKKAGRKLLATGNGRCNLTNDNILPEHFHGDVNQIAELLATYSPDYIKSYFYELGLLTFSDSEGRVYPYSRQAQSVLTVLMNTLITHNVEFIYEFAVNDICYKNKSYTISSEAGVQLSSAFCVLAAGGLASPKLSSGKNGNSILEKLSHTFTKLSPALLPFICKDKFIKNLQGVRSLAKVDLFSGSKLIATEPGEIQFASNSLSGVCMFNLSSHYAELKSKENCYVMIDFIPEIEFSELINILSDFISNNPSEDSEFLLDGLLNNKLGREILRECKIPLNIKYREIGKKQIFSIAKLIKSCRLNVSGVKTFDDAQVTHGGVPLKEINLKTMESKKAAKLYMCGEILNINGVCGGYNLHFAWSTGMRCGESIAEYYNGKSK